MKMDKMLSKRRSAGFSLGWSGTDAKPPRISPHIGHTGRGPTANILVKRGGVIKHTVHIGHIGCVPISNVLIKR
jgi:hypothetical protein